MFEGDMIRPLGEVTLNFGHAEYELDSFLERLAAACLLSDTWDQRPLGQKLTLLTDALGTLEASIHPALEVLVEEARQLIAQRNSLIHGCILAGGRIVTGRSGVTARRTSADELSSLAQRIFSWKERMWAFRWTQVEPLLKSRAPGCAT